MLIIFWKLFFFSQFIQYMSTCQISNFPAVSISNQSLVPFDIPWYLPSNNKNNRQNWNSIYSDEGALSIVCFLQMKGTRAQSGHPRSHRKYLLGQESTPGSSSSSSVHLRDSWQKLCKCQHSNVSCKSGLIFLNCISKTLLTVSYSFDGCFDWSCSLVGDCFFREYSVGTFRFPYLPHSRSFGLFILHIQFLFLSFNPQNSAPCI